MRIRRRPFARTRHALAAYDAADRAVGDATLLDDIERALERREAARDALGEAFAADTADLNERDIALSVPRCPAGVAFLRRLAHRKDR